MLEKLYLYLNSKFELIFNLPSNTLKKYDDADILSIRTNCGEGFFNKFGELIWLQ